MIQAPARRDVLYVNPQEKCLDLFPALHSAGWEPHPVSCPEHLRALREATTCTVGVVRLNERADVSRLSFLEGLLQQRDREWVALLPADLAADPDIKRLIADCCFDYLTLPVDVERIAATLGHAHGMAALKRDGISASAFDADDPIVGHSPAMLALRRDIDKLARSREPLLVSGERGSGKALIAKGIHDRSIRADAPFTAVDCSAISPEFRQFELLGYEKGAFAGAAQRHIGRIEAAAGGTLFLDQIGDLPLDLQTSLLHFLHTGQIQRVGGTQAVALDVRVIAASTVDLDEAVAQGRFRTDLFDRLGALRIRVPPLRDRRGDIESLARHFFRQSSRSNRHGPRGFSPEAMATMQRHHWPGNVGELANRIRRAVVMCETRLISSADLGLDAVGRSPALPTLDQARDQAERDILRDALDHSRGNVTRAARELGVSRVTLYRLLDKHRIRGGDAPAPASGPCAKDPH